MSYRVKVLARARRDVQIIFDWIAKRSRDGANRWYAAFVTCQDRLTHHPQGFALALEDDEVDFELRQALFKTRRGRTYRMVFTIVGKEVRVLRVRGPGQAPLTSDEIVV